MITKETIDKIFETARIEEVVGDFVQLKKRGANFIGLCPFHNEKTPSFNVSASKGIYKCFGCGKGGNAINFVMEHEHYSYPEALLFLASKYQIEVEEVELNPQQNAKITDRDALYVLNDFANDFFQKQLWESEEGKTIGLSYFKERGFSTETIRVFQLGYSPKQKDALSKIAQEASFKEKYLLESGLMLQNNQQSHDRFRERVIFPIHSFSGRILGFGGRTLEKDNKVKYINSPESSIYHKGNILYGIFFAKQTISRTNNCFLVEGYTDVISMHQAGIKNVVASSGTSLTVEQIRLIKRFTNNITILFDGDSAGIKASFRGIDMILAEGMNVKIVLFPNGEDPDSFARKNSQIALQEFLTNQSTDFISFKVNILADETKNDPSKRVEMIKEIAASIAKIPDEIGKAEYIKICSQMLQVKEMSLAKEVSKQPKEQIYTTQEKEELTETIQKEERNKEEREVLRILLNYGNETLKIENEQISIASFMIMDLIQDQILMQTETYQLLLQEIIFQIKQNEKIDLSYFIHHLNPTISKTTIDIISEKHGMSENWSNRFRILTGTEVNKMRKAVENALYSLKLKILDNKILDIQMQLKNDTENIETLTKTYANYIQVRKQIVKKLGRIIS